MVFCRHCWSSVFLGGESNFTLTAPKIAEYSCNTTCNCMSWLLTRGADDLLTNSRRETVAKWILTIKEKSKQKQMIDDGNASSCFIYSLRRRSLVGESISTVFCSSHGKHTSRWACHPSQASRSSSMAPATPVQQTHRCRLQRQAHTTVLHGEGEEGDGASFQKISLLPRTVSEILFFRTHLFRKFLQSPLLFRKILHGSFELFNQWECEFVTLNQPRCC